MLAIGELFADKRSDGEGEKRDEVARLLVAEGKPVAGLRLDPRFLVFEVLVPLALVFNSFISLYKFFNLCL